jgi:hypothetical protein
MSMMQASSKNFLPKNGLTCNLQHDVVSQKTELFITTAVRTSDPTRRHIPEDRTLHNLKSYTSVFHMKLSLFRPEDGGDTSSEMSPTFSALHGVISQKIELFITTVVRTSDPTRRHIPEDRTLHNHRCENLRSYTASYPRRYNSS